MSTADHVAAACGKLRASWAWLADALEVGNGRRDQRIITDAGRAQRDRQAAAERADRAKLLGTGKLLGGTTRTPVNVNAVDARTVIAEEADAVGWSLADQLRGWVQIPYRQRGIPYRPDGRTADATVLGALDYVAANVQHVTDAAWLGGAYERLVRCDDLATSTAGAGHQRAPMGVECPVCDRRALVWGEPTPTQAEAFVECVSPKCRCTGVDCPCKLPGRIPGMVHLWTQPRWATLADQLSKQAAA